MTIWEIARVLLRRWPIVMVGVLLTGTIGFVAIKDEGVYFTRTEILFLAPTSSLYPNALRTQSEDLIITAGVVAKRVTGPADVTKFASPEVTLVGLGVRDGWSLTLPDTGGQWATNFATQMLVLDIVGPTREAVLERQHEIVAEVGAELDELQRSADVDPVNDITVMVAPETTVIYHVGPSRMRTLAMVTIIGAGITTVAALVADRRRRRRRERRPEVVAVS